MPYFGLLAYTLPIFASITATLQEVTLSHAIYIYNVIVAKMV